MNKTGMIDLHLHTSASDGHYSPAELVDIAAQRQLDVIAITDHDTVEGVAPALQRAKRYPSLTVIAGIEISTYYPGSELHMLGYFIDFESARLLAALQRMRSERVDRARAMVNKLNNLGIGIKWEAVQRIASDSNIGRPHIALALLEAGYIEHFDQAFELYLAHGKPAYVERYKVTPEDAIRLIRDNGGLPVLAHPLTINNYHAVTAELAAAGLAGMEVYYKDFTAGERQDLLSLALRLNLVATGGSDYHGIDDTIEVLPGNAQVPDTVISQIIKRAAENSIKVPSTLEKYIC